MLDEGFYPPFLHTYEVSATTIVAKSQGKILRIAKIPKVDGFTLFAKKRGITHANGLEMTA